ncbi:MAG: putative DNA binding domain-containing protein, partial [Candidatus Lokiarchaeota archaeon]|nr:putative DNA binding domain-containing protein [Candidatus Lokiarchaeota archaeon]
SMAFVGNTRNELEFMLKHTNLFEEIPEQFYDSAFMDRLHTYLPGWEVEIIRGEMFSHGYGFVVDYLAEIMRKLRDYDYSNRYTDNFSLPTEISTRDRDGINKTFSGLMKILYPDGVAEKEEIEPILVYAIEGRKRIKDQLVRIDPTFNFVRFGYLDTTENFIPVKTVEEVRFPRHYYQRPDPENEMALIPDEEFSTEEPTSELDIIRMGESQFVEFKAALRWNIHTNAPDNRIEHSLLKTVVAFMNSDGGTLYVGVADDGEIVGIEEDRFPNDDKFLLHFGNLFNDKIGRQFTKYIDYEIVKINGKSVMKANCHRSPQPVFLKDKQRQDEFYVRHGPSSVELSMSEFNSYAKDRFGG